MNSIHPHVFLQTLGLAGVATAGFGQAALAQQANRPNVIIIYADDQGWGDVGVQGCPDVPTPALDALAQDGVRFTSAYVTCPLCSPSRAGMLTGRYQTRFGHEHNGGKPTPGGKPLGLPLDEVTLAERLKQEGYATAAFGKWHLGTRPTHMPLQQGFDAFYGFLGGGRSYFPDSPQGDGGPRDDDSSNRMIRGNQTVREDTIGQYTTDAFFREAIDFIDQHEGEPFFIYLAPNAVHDPMHAKDEDLARFASIDDENRRILAGMLYSLDENVGKLLAELDERGLDENTIVFYMSDNGAPTVNWSYNGPFSGSKGRTLEGGIRVPFMVRWPGKLPAGAVIDTPVISMDMYATVLDALGLDASRSAPDKPLDGRSLLPFADDPDYVPHDRLYWRMGPASAMREGDYKLQREPGDRWALYNLADDPQELNDLAQEQPERLLAMKAAWEAWSAQQMDPLWANWAENQMAGEHNGTWRRETWAPGRVLDQAAEEE